MASKLQFGRLSTQPLCRNLFYLGCLPLLRPVIRLVAMAAARFPYERSIQTVDGWFSSVSQPNYLLGIAIGAIFFCLAATLWWHICEILYHLIQYLRSNTQPSPIFLETHDDKQV